MDWNEFVALFIAFEMFEARYGGFMQTLDERKEAEEDIHGIAITPLAFPLLVGPAELGVMITLSNDSPAWTAKLLLVACAVLTGILIAVTLWMATRINRDGKNRNKRGNTGHGADRRSDRH